MLAPPHPGVTDSPLTESARDGEAASVAAVKGAAAVALLALGPAGGALAPFRAGDTVESDSLTFECSGLDMSMSI